MNDNKQKDEVTTPSAASSRPVASVGTPIAPNYGSMDLVNNEKPLSTNQIEATSERLNNTVIANNNNKSEAPRPAIRRKILQKELQLRMAANNNNKNNNNNNNSSSDGQSLAIKNVKQQVGLPTAENFQIMQRENSEQASSTKSRCNRPYPKKVAFIVANEFCERFSYYGLRAVLVLYFKSVLGFDDAASTVSFHLFTTLCYLMPILGAILGDAIWGKYKTILYLSGVYFLGELTLVIASVFWELNALSVTSTFVGLLLIGIGTGGIKPCVCAFGGDQFHSHETEWRERFFSYFYAAINFGSLISMFLTPVLRSNYQCFNRTDCYPLAFGVPCVVMFISILLFVAAHNYYTVAPLPEQNVLVAFGQCVCLALKRKLTGAKSFANEQPKGTPLMEHPKANESKHKGEINHGLSSSADNTSNSSISMASESDKQLVVAVLPNNNNIASRETTTTTTSNGKLVEVPLSPPPTPVEVQNNEKHLNEAENSERDRNHWLYLASDKFDTESIENFRTVLGIFLIFLPTPIYWSLYDQQGSLWTLQAARMSGDIPGTNFTLEPDQMMVANPLLLLAAIALFQVLFYPCLNKFNLLSSYIQRMTAGGIVAALAFVASALIETQMQQSMPKQEPPSGYSSLLLVNGLSDCSIVNPTISYVQIPSDLVQPIAVEEQQFLSSLNASMINSGQKQHHLDYIEPLKSIQFNLISPSSGDNNNISSAFTSAPLNNYQFKFKLANGKQPVVTTVTPVALALSGGNSSNNNLIINTENQFMQMCPFDSNQLVELSVGVLPEKSSKLLYIQQGNGKLAYKLFNDTMALPPAGKAKVRILFEYFGSSNQAITRQFSLVQQQQQKQPSSQHNGNTSEPKFHFSTHDGQVLLSDYIDVNVASVSGIYFNLKLSDSSLSDDGNTSIYVNSRSIDLMDNKILLKPGTRNLLIVHQSDSKTYEFQHELLQDNEYRVSMLYQLIPYSLISISEVMFSITGFEFSYSMAPESMKSLILGALLFTVALGNIFTVVVETIQPFSNLAHKFFFYAALMILDMIAFAFIGYYYKPYKPKSTSTDSQQQ